MGKGVLDGIQQNTTHTAECHQEHPPFTHLDFEISPPQTTYIFANSGDMSGPHPHTRTHARPRAHTPTPPPRIIQSMRTVFLNMHIVHYLMAKGTNQCSCTLKSFPSTCPMVVKTNSITNLVCFICFGDCLGVQAIFNTSAQRSSGQETDSRYHFVIQKLIPSVHSNRDLVVQQLCQTIFGVGQTETNCHTHCTILCRVILGSGVTHPLLLGFRFTCTVR